jgi:hypothetical protein
MVKNLEKDRPSRFSHKYFLNVFSAIVHILLSFNSICCARNKRTTDILHRVSNKKGKAIPVTGRGDP